MLAGLSRFELVKFAATRAGGEFVDKRCGRNAPECIQIWGRKDRARTVNGVLSVVGVCTAGMKE